MGSVPTRQDENVEYTVEDCVQEAVSVSVCHSVVVKPGNGGQFVILYVCPEHVEIVVLVVLFAATETGKTFLTHRLMTSVAVTYSLGLHVGFRVFSGVCVGSGLDGVGWFFRPGGGPGSMPGQSPFTKHEPQTCC